MDCRGDYDHLTYDKMHDLRRRGGYAGEDLKEELNAGPATTDAPERKGNCDMADDADTPETLSGKLNAMDASDDLPATQEERRRASDLHLASVAEKGKVKEHAQWRGPEMEARWGATLASLCTERARRSPRGR